MHDVLLFQSIAFWGLLATLLTGLMAPFGKWAKTSDAHWIPLALGAASLVGSLISGRSKQKAEEKAANQAYMRQQQYAKSISPNGLMSQYGEDTPIGQWLRSNDPSVNKSTSSYNQTTTTNPFITGEYKGVHGLAKGLVENRLKSGGSLPEGFQSQGLRAINRAHANTGAQAEGLGVRSGSFSPGVGASAMEQDSARRGKIADFMTSVPMLERQNQTEDLSIANEMTARFGLGSTSRTSGSSEGSSWTEGDLSPGQQFLMQAFLNSKAAEFGGAGPAVKQGAGGLIGQGISGAAGLLGQLYGSGAFGKDGGSQGASGLPWTPNTGANFGQNSPMNFRLGR